MAASDLLTRGEPAAGRGAGAWRRWGRWARRIEGPARVAAQTAFAAVVTFGLFKITGLPQVSWAVISALFVIQPNVGGTISTAFGRIAGTALGTALGLACVLTLGASAWAIALGLFVATAGLGLVIGFRPDLRYALVPAAFILLAPGGEVVETAWHGAAAIGIGAVIGAFTGVLVFPEPAHRALERHLGEALKHCSHLLLATVKSLLGDSSLDQVRAAGEKIESEVWAAGSLAAQSRYPSGMRRRNARHPRPRELLRAVERLSHSLFLMARAGEAPLPQKACDELLGALEAFAEVGSSYLRLLGQALTRNTPPPLPDRAGEQVQELEEALGRLRQRGATRPLGSHEAERIFTLAFAVQELNRNIDEVARLFSGPSTARGR